MEEKRSGEEKMQYKQLTLQYLKSLLEFLQSSDSLVQKENQSFVYFEKDTLNLLFIYLISQLNDQPSYIEKEKDPSLAEELDQLNKALDEMIENKIPELDKILNLLKRTDDSFKKNIGDF